MLWTIVAPWRGLLLVCNKILLLLSGKRIPKDNRGLTSIPFGRIIYVFLKTQTTPGYEVFNIEFVSKYSRCILFIINRCNSLIFWVGMLRWLLFRRSSLFLILLFLTIGILCRLHRVHHSGRKSSLISRGVHYHLGNGTTELFYNNPRGCVDNPVGGHFGVLSGGSIRVIRSMGYYVIKSARLWINQI